MSAQRLDGERKGRLGSQWVQRPRVRVDVRPVAGVQRAGTGLPEPLPEAAYG